MNYTFSLREAESDINGFKVLGPYSGIQDIELDYALAAGQALGEIDQFLTPAPLPNSVLWAAGNYTVALAVVNAQNISFSVALYRCDANGNILQQIGLTPAVQTAAAAAPTNPVVCSFVIAGAQIATNPTDRLLVQVLAQNTDGSNPHEFSILAGTSGVDTPIGVTIQDTDTYNTYRRNKFLGIIPRAGERFGYFDKNGVNLDGQNSY